jgi:hypothetical protein
VWRKTYKRYLVLACGFIRDEKPIVLFGRHRHAAEKSEAIASARRYLSS